MAPSRMLVLHSFHSLCSQAAQSESNDRQNKPGPYNQAGDGIKWVVPLTLYTMRWETKRCTNPGSPIRKAGWLV